MISDYGRQLMTDMHRRLFAKERKDEIILAKRIFEEATAADVKNDDERAEAVRGAINRCEENNLDDLDMLMGYILMVRSGWKQEQKEKMMMEVLNILGSSKDDTTQ